VFFDYFNVRYSHVLIFRHDHPAALMTQLNNCWVFHALGAFPDEVHICREVSRDFLYKETRASQRCGTLGITKAIV
jgi:hypothetical protein